MWAHSISGGRFSLIVAGAMLLSWAFRGFGNWKLGKARLVLFLFVGFWMWSVLLAFGADSPPHAWYFVEQIGKILLPFLVGITTVRDIKDLKALAWVIVLCQGYVCFDLNVRYFQGYNFLYFNGLAVSTTTPQRLVLWRRWAWRSSCFSTPNRFRKRESLACAWPSSCMRFCFRSHAEPCWQPASA